MSLASSRPAASTNRSTVGLVQLVPPGVFVSSISPPLLFVIAVLVGIPVENSAWVVSVVAALFRKREKYDSLLTVEGMGILHDTVVIIFLVEGSTVPPLATIAPLLLRCT